MTTNWQDDALCAGVPPIIFYPLDGDTDRARAFCARCPVTVECLEFALELGDKFGVWGGTTERERRELRRARRRDTAAA